MMGRGLYASTAAAAAVVVAASVSVAAAAFSPSAAPPAFHRLAPSSSAPRSSSAVGMSDMGSVEEIEFRIYPDGRVEETVRGVRGESCHDVTEKINEALGKEVTSRPTEEMYENELLVESVVVDKVDGGGESGGGGGGGGGGGWEGSSSW